MKYTIRYWTQLTTAYLFQIIPLSDNFKFCMSFHKAFILTIPSLMTGPVLNTAAWVCMVFCILSLIAAVLTSPSAYLHVNI